VVSTRELITALRTLAPLSADGIAVGVKDVVVDQVGSAYLVTYLGLLRGTLGNAYGLTVPPNSLVAGYDVTLNAVGGTFTLGTANPNSAGATRTWALGWNASAADIAAALSTLYGVAVTVTKTPGPSQLPAAVVLHIPGLTGQTLTIDDRNLDNPLYTLGRRSGLRYKLTESQLDTLNIDFGSNGAGDVINVQGTTAITNVFAHGGNDRFYVSELANETLASAPTTDFLEGNLDFIRGNLNLSAGDGRHKLFVSDEASTIADTNVMITDHATWANRLAGSEIEVSGLAPKPIDYQASATGNFADGITYWSGYGDDTITIDGTHERAPLRTVTTLNTGLGNDTVHVSLTAVQDGFFVLNTQGPYNQFTSYRDNDTVDAETPGLAVTTLPIVVFGGQGSDWIRGGEGGDLIFGDRGRVVYFGATGLPTAAITDAQLAATEAVGLTVLGHGGPGDKTDGVVRPVGLAITVDRTIGGSDTIYGQGGEDVLIGGSAGDGIDGGTADDLIFGDQVQLVRGSTNDPRFQIESGAIYSTTAADRATNAMLTGVQQTYRDPGGHTPDWAFLEIVNLYQTDSWPADNSWGNDYIAGGAANEMIFGQLGNDVIQGDGSIDYAATGCSVGAA
jgi:hypothetical protein